MNNKKKKLLIDFISENVLEEIRQVIKYHNGVIS